MTGAQTRVTAAEITAGLRELGVAPGDTVLVHAAMSTLGFVEGGPDAVIDALLEAVGPAGTLAMPAFSFQINDTPDFVFDVLNTPVWASKLYERFRTRDFGGEHPRAFRSHHASHSVAAVGARARELTAEHGPYPCQAPSPFAKLPQWGAKILFLGVSHNSNTSLHAVEETLPVPYMVLREIAGVMMVDEERRAEPLKTFVHGSRQPYDFNRLSDLFDREGVQRQRLIGDSLVRCADARRMWEVASEAARRDPFAMAQQGEARIAIPVCRADLGM